MPRRQTAALLAILFGVLAAWIAAWILAPGNPLAPRSWLECLHVCIFHASLSLAYIVAYTAIEHRSPSMTVLISVADSGGAGRSRDELRSLLQDAMPVERRLDAMAREGMIVADGPDIRLAAKGRAWAAALSVVRRLLGLPRGG